MNKQEMLNRAITDAKLRDYTYAEIKEYYLDKYGQRGWIGGYAQAVAGTSTRSGKEYLSVRRQIERVEKGTQKTSVYTTDVQATRVSRKEELPALKDNVNLTIRAKQNEKVGGRTFEMDRTVKVNVSFSGDNPTWEDVWEHYDLDYDFAEEGEYALSAYSVVAA